MSGVTQPRTLSQPSVSAIVPAHGSKEHLRQCLEGLTSQQLEPHEIIVSVDGCDEGLADVGRAYGAKVLVNPQQHGPAVARNLGAAVTTGEILLFVDSDVVCPATVVGMVARTFGESPEVAALFGSYDDSPADPGFFSQFRNLLHHYVHQKAHTQARTFWAGCGAMRRQVFEAFGGFSERYRQPAAEDIELGYRLTEAGHSVVLCKALQVKHLKRWTWRSTLRVDLLTRSLCWSRLLIESRGRYVNDLNMDWISRASMAVSLVLLAWPAATMAIVNPLPGVAVLAMIWATLNWDILRFFARVRGMGFAIRVIPVLWLHYICGGLGYGLAWLEWGVKQTGAISRRWTGRCQSHANGRRVERSKPLISRQNGEGATPEGMVSAKSKVLGLPAISDASSSGVFTPDSEQLPVFVINLDADGQRLAAMREQLDSLGLIWERIPAVDGTALPPDVLLRENRRARPRRLSAGEVGCLQSHVAVWQRIAEARAPAALVLEDDVLLAPDCALLAKDPTWLVDQDCIVRLETFAMRVVLGPRVRAVQGRDLYPLRSIQHGAAAYILTRWRAQALLRAYGELVDTADRLMFCDPRKNCVYQLSPAPCIQRDIHEHDRRIDGGHSRLEKERARMLRQSWLEPLAVARRLKGKVGSVAGIGFDVARGYALRVVPYG